MDQNLSTEFLRIVGHPEAVLVGRAEGRTFCEVETLHRLLFDDKIAHHRLVVLSVLGTIRKGKSFLMNLILRYLTSKCKSTWITNLDQAMEGFSWSSGLDKETVGIFVWSELFTMKIDNEDVVILVVDTQGMFSRQSSFEDNCTIAALTLLMSSSQLLNMEYYVDESMSDFTEVFINYANLIIDHWCIKKPFQNIMAIVRDWVNLSEYSYGLQGGDSFLSSSTCSKFSNFEHSQFKRYYKKLFNKLQCFLMPHPGLKASNNPNFDGRLRDLEPIFLEQLKILIPTIVCSENLSPKKINDHYLNCKEFFYYFKSLVRIINRRSFPKISDILTENGNINKWELFEQMSSYYISQIDKFCEAENEFLTQDKLKNEHLRLCSIIYGKLEHSKKFNSTVITENLQTFMSQHLQNLSFKFAMENSNKNIKMGIFTPYALIILLGLFYFISHISTYSHLQVLINCTYVAFYMSLLLVFLWILSCGYQIEELSGFLDFIADTLIFYVYNPIIMGWKNKPAKLLNTFYESVYASDDIITD